MSIAVLSPIIPNQGVEAGGNGLRVIVTVDGKSELKLYDDVF
jgi:hypothetical protein